MRVIEIEHLSRDFGGGKGIFDVSFQVGEGDVYKRQPLVGAWIEILLSC